MTLYVLRKLNSVHLDGSWRYLSNPQSGEISKPISGRLEQKYHAVPWAWGWVHFTCEELGKNNKRHSTSWKRCGPQNSSHCSTAVGYFINISYVLIYVDNTLPDSFKVCRHGGSQDQVYLQWKLRGWSSRSKSGAESRSRSRAGQGWAVFPGHSSRTLCGTRGSHPPPATALSPMARGTQSVPGGQKVAEEGDTMKGYAGLGL